MSRLVLLIVPALAIACGALNDGSHGRSIRFPQAVNPSHPRVTALERFGDRLEAATGGRLRLELFPGGQLYGARGAVEAATFGDVEMALEPETHFITFDDAFRAVDIPFLFESEEAFRRFLDGRFRDRVAGSLEERGLVLVALWDEGPMVLGARGRRLQAPEDFQGVRIRSSGHDLLARTWNRLGATTIRLPIEEVYTALQQGVADAIYTTLYTFVAGKFHEVAPKAVIWPSRATYVWVVHRGFFRGLSPEDRRLIQRLSRDATSEYYRSLARSRDEMVETIEAEPGGVLHQLDASELERLRERTRELWTGWRSEYADVLGDIDGES